MSELLRLDEPEHEVLEKPDEQAAVLVWKCAADGRGGKAARGRLGSCQAQQYEDALR